VRDQVKPLTGERARTVRSSVVGRACRVAAGIASGVRVEYGSSSSALAVLEVLVHLENPAPLPAYSMVIASVPDDSIEEYDVRALPVNWSTSPVPPEIQAIGDEWVRSGRSLALRVPSAVVPHATNLLINPEHPDFARVSVESTDPFTFDPRLF
jgi:RES domain-containing protein